MSRREIEPNELYQRIGRLIEETPKIKSDGNALDAPTQAWLGRAYALITCALGQGYDHQLRQIARVLTVATRNRSSEVDELNGLLYSALAVAELSAPAAPSGAFLPAGSPFDVFAALTKVLGGASSDVLFVDPYMDEKLLTEYAPIVAEGILVKLLSDPATRKPSLEPAVRSWLSQYGARRPLDARLTSSRALHDRMIIVDGNTVWTVSQSFNAIAKRSPASITKAPDEIAALKIDAYADLWSSASSLV